MPRQRSLVTVIRDLAQKEVRSAIHALFGGISAPTTRKSATNGRRRRRRTRGTWRPGGPGRPPKAVAAKIAKKTPATASKTKTVRRRRRRPRPAGSKRKTA